MTPKQIDAFCATLPAATRTVQWEGVVVFKVGGKMFCLIAPPDIGRPHLLQVRARALRCAAAAAGLPPGALPRPRQVGQPRQSEGPDRRARPGPTSARPRRDRGALPKKKQNELGLTSEDSGGACSVNHLSYSVANRRDIGYIDLHVHHRSLPDYRPYSCKLARNDCEAGCLLRRRAGRGVIVALQGPARKSQREHWEQRKSRKPKKMGFGRADDLLSAISGNWRKSCDATHPVSEATGVQAARQNSRNTRKSKAPENAHRTEADDPAKKYQKSQKMPAACGPSPAVIQRGVVASNAPPSASPGPALRSGWQRCQAIAPRAPVAAPARL